MQIEHDPKEPKIDRTNTVFYTAWAFVALAWILTWYIGDAHWPSIALGGFTGIVLATWAIETTGNKMWWKR